MSRTLSYGGQDDGDGSLSPATPLTLDQLEVAWSKAAEDIRTPLQAAVAT